MAEKDSFDLLIKALFENGFKLPHSIKNREFVDPLDQKRFGDDAHQMNRAALIKALTDSGWVAG